MTDPLPRASRVLPPGHTVVYLEPVEVPPGADPLTGLKVEQRTMSSQDAAAVDVRAVDPKELGIEEEPLIRASQDVVLDRLREFLEVEGYVADATAQVRYSVSVLVQVRGAVRCWPAVEGVTVPKADP